MTGKQDLRVPVVFDTLAETVAQSLNYGTCTQITSAYSGHYHHFTVLTYYTCGILYRVQERLVHTGCKIHPANEIISGATAFFKGFNSIFYLRLKSFDATCRNETLNL